MTHVKQPTQLLLTILLIPCTAVYAMNSDETANRLLQKASTINATGCLTPRRKEINESYLRQHMRDDVPAWVKTEVAERVLKQNVKEGGIPGWVLKQL